MAGAGRSGWRGGGQGVSQDGARRGGAGQLWRKSSPPSELPADVDTLSALCRGALAISSDLDVEQVLQRIVAVARELTTARYAACGVPGDDGFRHFINSGLDTETAALIGHSPEGRGLLGLMLRQTESVRLADLSGHAESAGFPAQHPRMTSFLGVPIVYRDRTIGDSYLCDTEDGRPFSARDQVAVEVLAGFAAVAITNSYQYLQVNEALAQNRDELQETSRRLQALSDRTLWMLESERRVLAQELHDGVGEVLAAAIMAGESIQEGRSSPADASERLAGMLRGAVQDVRRISQGLRPTMLDELGPDAAIRDAVEQMSTDSRTITYEVRGAPRRLPEPVEPVVFRVAQEALTNAVPHSSAAHIDVRLAFGTVDVRLTVSDDGIGLPAILQEQGLGITGMRERARLVRGRLEFSSPPGMGVRVRLSVPVD